MSSNGYTLYLVGRYLQCDTDSFKIARSKRRATNATEERPLPELRKSDLHNESELPKISWPAIEQLIND